jgi:hypothetical protein
MRCLKQPLRRHRIRSARNTTLHVSAPSWLAIADIADSRKLGFFRGEAALMKAVNGPRIVLAGMAMAGLVISADCRANDSTASEISHVFAGMAIAGGATAAADYFGAGQNRGWIGFGVSVGVSFIEESAQVISNGSSQIRGSSLDFASNLVGAAIGAWVTDKYFLAPVVTKDATGHQRIGIAMRMSF